MNKFYVHKKLDQEEIDIVYRKYHSLVNMSASELERWAENLCSTGASLDRSPIKRNLRLLRTRKEDWGAREVRSANRTISFISRMRGMEQGEPIKVDGKQCPSKRDISLRNWAFNPSKANKMITPAEQTEEDEDKRYSDALKAMIRGFRSEVFKAIDENLQEERDMTKKSFYSLMQKLNDIFKIDKYSKRIIDAIKYHYKQGITDAEQRINQDVGFTNTMEEQVRQITQRNIDGYAIGDTVWNGISGMTDDVQKEVIEALTQDMNDGTSLPKMKASVNAIMRKYLGTEVMGTITQGRVERIARTEANRIRNEGRLATYQESGVSGKLMWNATKDNRVSEICKELDGKVVGVDEEFYSTVTNQYYKVPPAHVNCRSVVEFILE